MGADQIIHNLERIIAPNADDDTITWGDGDPFPSAPPGDTTTPADEESNWGEGGDADGGSEGGC